jgi:hypothetical protein
MAGCAMQAIAITSFLCLIVDICTGTSDSAVLTCIKGETTSSEHGREISRLNCSGISLTSLHGQPGGILINSSMQLTLL